MFQQMGDLRLKSDRYEAIEIESAQKKPTRTGAEVAWE